MVCTMAGVRSLKKNPNIDVKIFLQMIDVELRLIYRMQF